MTLDYQSIGNGIDRLTLQAIAKYQRIIIICIVVYMAAFAGQFIAPTPILKLVFLFIILADWLMGFIYLIRLTLKMYSIGNTIVFSILYFLPLFGLIILLLVNGKATETLKKNGIQVGFFGAKGPIQ